MRKKRVRITLLGIAVFLVLGSCGCGASKKSPEGVVKALITGYVDGDENKVKDCYGEKKAVDGSLQKEIDATTEYYKAHRIKKLKIKESGILSKENDLTYVYAIYSLVLEDKQEYPCVGTYMVEKNEKGYHVLPSSKITQDMSKRAAEEYGDFMKTDSYKNYEREYEIFIKKNPGYEQRLGEKLS